ncbi:MAG: hypothetical protein WBL44_09780 [Nitrososphaeraceae archaeon]
MQQPLIWDNNSTASELAAAKLARDSDESQPAGNNFASTYPPNLQRIFNI